MQEYLISQHRNKCDNNNVETFNSDHISLDVLNSDRDANDNDEKMMAFVGAVFLNSEYDNVNNNISAPLKESEK